MSNLVKFLNREVKDVVGCRRYTGDLFGLELEMEGRDVHLPHYWPDGTLELFWTQHADGSLRANHGSAVEWVFKKPMTYDKAVEAVDVLFDRQVKQKSKIVTSNRTSTHVHYNMSDKTVLQVCNLFFVFTVVEDLLDRFCGEDRNGNLFCLSSRHAEYTVEAMKSSMLEWFNFGEFREELRYSSINLNALNKFGTVEFRGMRGLDKANDVVDWLSIVNDLCKFGCNVGDPFKDIVSAVSIKGCRGFLREIFSEKNYNLLTNGLTDYEIERSLYEGLRLIQTLTARVSEVFDKVVIPEPDFWARKAPEDVPYVEPEKVRARGLRGRPEAPRAIQGGFIGEPRVVENVREDDFMRQVREVQARLAAQEAPHEFVAVWDRAMAPIDDEEI